MEKQKQIDTNWLDQEIQDQQTKQLPTGEKLPKLKLEPKKTTAIKIDPTKPFGQWSDPMNGTPFAIIEVIHDKERKVFFLNKKNPIYREILQGLKNGKLEFKIFRIGTLRDTRYELIE